MATVDAEVHQIERVSTLAKQRIGLLGIVLMWNLFQSVNPNNPVQSYQVWFGQALRIARATALMMRGIAKSQYRLTRALDAGVTVAWSPDEAVSSELGLIRQHFIDRIEDALELGSRNNSLPDDDDVSYFNEIVADMRDEFAELADRLAGKETRSADAVRDLAGADTITEDTIEKNEDLLSSILDDIINDPSLPHDTEVEVDIDFSDLADEDDEFFEQFFEDSRREFEQSVRENYIVELENVVERRIGDDWSAEDAVREIRQLADEAGLNASAWIEKLAQEQGRYLVDKAAARDNRQLFAARKTGSNPCAFCAMLAGRGYVYTKSTAGGTLKKVSRNGNAVDASEFDANGFRAYHPNCQCSVVYRWQDTPEADDVADYLNGLYRDAGDMKEFRRVLDRIRRENGGSLNLYF